MCEPLHLVAAVGIVGSTACQLAGGRAHTHKVQQEERVQSSRAGSQGGKRVRVAERVTWLPRRARLIYTDCAKKAFAAKRSEDR